MGVPFSLSSFWAPTGHLDGLFWPLFEKYGPRKSEVYFGIDGAVEMPANSEVRGASAKWNAPMWTCARSLEIVSAR